MRILVLGAGGQVGRELVPALAPVGEVVPATRSGRLADGRPCPACDLAVPGSAADLVAGQHPAVVVNAAAYTAVDRAESEPDLADRINHLAVAELAVACREAGARLVHFSTDYVFDGEASRPYREDDAVAPRSAYGRSKLAGEQALAASGANHLVLRLAWVYAAHGRNFPLTMLRLARERDRLGVVDDQVGAPTPARWIAAATALLVHAHRDLSGVHHLAPAGHTSWHGLCRLLFDEARATGLLETLPGLDAITTADYPTPARRPAYSCLDSGRLKAATGLALPDWRLGVGQLLGELAARPPQ